MGTMEVDHQQHQVKKEDISIRLAVSVCVFCTAAAVTHEDGRRRVLVAGPQRMGAGG